EDGIRDRNVTGVQTCALPISAQYEFRPGWLGEVAYVGSKGRNLLVLQNIGTGNDEGGPGSREVTGVGAVIATRYRGKSSYNSLQIGRASCRERVQRSADA